MRYVVNAAGAARAEGGYEQGDARADVGAGHAAGAQAFLAVVAYHDGPVWVAEDYLRAHVDQFVNEEQAALEHLLVEQHAAPRLCGDDEQHGEQVGREARPGRVGQGHDGAVDERFYLVMLPVGYYEVVAVNVYSDAELAEGFRYDAEVAHGDVLYAYAVAHHGGHADERAHLNHVWQDGVRRSVQALHAHDGEQV